MTHVAELRLPPRRLAVKTALRIARARMGVVPALLFGEVRAIAAAAAILGTKALLRGPGLDQGSIDREMFVRQKRLHLAVVQKLGHELLKHVAVLQPLAVLRKCRRSPYRIIRRKPDEPAVQKDCSSIVPSAAAPSGCHRRLGARARSAIVPAGSRGAPRSHRASQRFGSGLSELPEPVHESFAMDGALARAPLAKYKKTIRPDPEMPRASWPPNDS